MVKTRTTSSNKNLQTAFDHTMSRFASTITHRKVTETVDDNGSVIGRTTADTAFTGALIDDMRTLRKYIPYGEINVGDGILYVSSSDSESGNIAIESKIIEGVAGDGSSQVWEVVALLDAPDPKGETIYYAWKLAKRFTVTL